jgi:hypothetical protein
MIEGDKSQKLNSADEPSEKTLLTALKENWLHARHEESQRFWFLNIYIVVTGAIIKMILEEGLSSITAIASLVFLFVLSLSVFLIIIKVNAEFSNHIRAIQWIAEKLKLIKAVQADNKKIMFKGVMALPLPLPRYLRAHIIFMCLPLLITSASLSLLTYSILNEFKDLLSLVSQQVLQIICSLIVFIVSAFILYFAFLKKAESACKKLLDGRKPHDIEIEYPN